MLSNGFQSELKRLFTLFCGQANWLCWITSKESASQITADSISEATLEERVLLRQLTFDSSGQVVLHAHHAIFQLPAVRQSLNTGTVVFHQFTVGDQQLTIACKTGLLPRHEIVSALLQDKWKECITKQHLARHLAQQEERIESAENRLAEFQHNWKKQVGMLLENWQIQQFPYSVELDADLPDYFVNEFDTRKITEQLDASLAMQQFVQPAETHFYLSKSTMTVSEQLSPTPQAASLTSNQRAALLLDKYEESARSAQRKGIAVSGKTIAEQLQPSISPPAITDALKKNRKAISALVHQHPDKWPLLRRYLKPVKELHERHGMINF